jgi:hypothetical protein
LIKKINVTKETLTPVSTQKTGATGLLLTLSSQAAINGVVPPKRPAERL